MPKEPTMVTLTSPINFELRHLRSFLVLARTLSYVRAAEALSIVQPALTRQIKDLEYHLGVRLFERGTTGTTLTPAGKELVPLANEIMRSIADARTAMSRFDGTTLRARLGASSGVAVATLSSLIAEAQAEFPEIEIDVIAGYTEQLVEDVRSRRIDAALIHPPVNAPDMITRHIYSEPLVLAGPSPEQETIQSDKLIIFPEVAGPALYHTLRRIAREVFGDRFIISFSESFSARLAMVAAGSGWSVFPRSMVADQPLRIRTHPELPELATAVVYPETLRDSRVSEVWQFLQTREPYHRP